MQQQFNSALNAHVTRDDSGLVRSIVFRRAQGIDSFAPMAAAAGLLRQMAKELNIAPGELDNLSQRPDQFPTDAGVEYRFLEEKRQQATATVAFHQTCFGLPVWHAGLSVTMKTGPLRPVRIHTTFHPRIEAKKPSKNATARFGKLTKHNLYRLLNLDKVAKRTSGQKVSAYDVKSLKINRTRFMIYQYDAAKRLGDEPTHSTKDEKTLHSHPFTLPVPSIDDRIRNGEHYVVLEVLFTLNTGTGKPLNWVALIEVESGAVLLLRALIDNALGMVFESDPSTQNAGASPSQNALTLDPYTTSVTLPNVNGPTSGNPWTLDGANVAISDFEVPIITPPSEAAGTFNYSSRTDNFAAVNAYYHCDRFFRLVEDMGFLLPSYFDGTVFPIHVDHRGHYGTSNGIEVNAYCGGNGTSNGIGNVAYMLADLTDTAAPLGIASDWRVVLHELGGHGILWDHVNWPNFGFAHSAGDSFAAILNDPATAWGDRYETFPFSFQSLGVGLRRHDRAVGSGWAWGGTSDVGGYNSEQILCTTHFRIYKSIGGDSSYLPFREFAARYVAYLILNAVGTLTSATNPPDPETYADALMAADLPDWVSEGESGGAYGKVIRWAFEKQGMYQPVGAPTPVTTEGDPPEMDVYIDDGRAGEYQFQPVHWNNQSIWNRIAADGVATHEEPIVGQPNYGYVIVGNRGTQTATGITVRGFHCIPGSGLVWPNTWQPMTTAMLSCPDLAPGASATVGPFEWTPSQLGHECMLMISAATDDPSNADLFTGGSDSIPEWRLVPNDNNIGQRNVHPVAALHGLSLMASIREKTFTVTNSFRKRAIVQLETAMPKFLTDRGWELKFVNAGQGSFTLEAGEKKVIQMDLVGGKDFTKADVVSAGIPMIEITTVIAGTPVGGMTFYLDPNPREKFTLPDHDSNATEDLAKLLRCLKAKVKCIKVKSINVDLVIDDNCGCN